jgi:hypothetical protein
MPAHRHGEPPGSAPLTAPAHLTHRPIAMTGGDQRGQVELTLPIALAARQDHVQVELTLPIALAARQDHVLAHPEVLGDRGEIDRGGHAETTRSFGVKKTCFR